METDGRVEKQSTVFPHVLAKRLGAFCTVPTGFTAVNPQTTKPDISFATKTGHFYLLLTAICGSWRQGIVKRIALKGQHVSVEENRDPDDDCGILV